MVAKLRCQKIYFFPGSISLQEVDQSSPFFCVVSLIYLCIYQLKGFFHGSVSFRDIKLFQVYSDFAMGTQCAHRCLLLFPYYQCRYLATVRKVYTIADYGAPASNLYGYVWGVWLKILSYQSIFEILRRALRAVGPLAGPSYGDTFDCGQSSQRKNCFISALL